MVIIQMIRNHITALEVCLNMKRMVQHYNVETFTHFTHGRMNEINHIQTNINSKRKKIRIYTSVIFKDSKQQ